MGGWSVFDVFLNIGLGSCSLSVVWDCHVIHRCCCCVNVSLGVDVSLCDCGCIFKRLLGVFLIDCLQTVVGIFDVCTIWLCCVSACVFLCFVGCACFGRS